MLVLVVVVSNAGGHNRAKQWRATTDSAKIQLPCCWFRLAGPVFRQLWSSPKRRRIVTSQHQVDVSTTHATRGNPLRSPIVVLYGGGICDASPAPNARWHISGITERSGGEASAVKDRVFSHPLWQQQGPSEKPPLAMPTERALQAGAGADGECEPSATRRMPTRISASSGGKQAPRMSTSRSRTNSKNPGSWRGAK